MYKNITVNCLEELYNSPNNWRGEKAAMTNDTSQNTIRQERLCATHVKWDDCNNKGIIRQRIVFISEKSLLWRTPYVLLWSICPQFYSRVSTSNKPWIFQRSSTTDHRFSKDDNLYIVPKPDGTFMLLFAISKLCHF